MRVVTLLSVVLMSVLLIALDSILFDFLTSRRTGALAGTSREITVSKDFNRMECVQELHTGRDVGTRIGIIGIVDWLRLLLLDNHRSYENIEWLAMRNGNV